MPVCKLKLPPHSIPPQEWTPSGTTCTLVLQPRPNVPPETMQRLWRRSSVREIRRMQNPWNVAWESPRKVKATFVRLVDVDRAEVEYLNRTFLVRRSRVEVPGPDEVFIRDVGEHAKWSTVVLGEVKR